MTTDTTRTPRTRRPRVRARTAVPIAAVALAAGGIGGGIATAFRDGSGTAAPATTTVVAAAQPASATSSAITSVYDRVVAGVVDIRTTGTTTGGPFGESQQSSGEGSGLVLDRQGHIVTNYHVVEGASAITVHFSDGTTAKATVVGSDASTDLAVLRVDVAAAKLRPLTLGTSSTVQVGQGVLAIGSPFGLDGTATAGIVSAVGRTIEAPDGATIAGAVQTDAAINPGNSGGPLFDSAGRVIGVNAQIESSGGGNDGIGFAIPIDTVKRVAAALIAGDRVAHPFLGVQVSDSAAGGAQIESVQAGSPAASAGLRAGDVVTAVGGTRIASATALTNAIGAAEPGKTVSLTVRRDGSTLTVRVTIGERA